MRIHIAGIDVMVSGRWHRQRCAWCSAVLCDYDLERVAVPAGQTGGPSMWPTGSLVAVDGGMSYAIELDSDGRMPPGTCARIETEL